MDSDSIYRSITLIVLVVVGGLLAGMETAYSSCNKIRLKYNAENGDIKSERVLKIIEQSDKSITTILILLNIVHILAASIATVLAVNILGEIGSLVSTIALTLIIFTFSEVLPKSIAKDNADSYAIATARVLRFLVIIFTPLSYVLSATGRLLRKIFGTKTKEPTMTEDELQSMIETIEEEGVLESDQSELIQSAIDFLDTTAADILTPRVDIVAVDIDWRKEKIDSTVIKEKYSRLPVYENTIDKIIGVLQSRQYLKGMLNNSALDIRAIMDKPIFVHQSMLVNTLFEMMSARRVHMVIVTDDYGGTAGLITMEDIMEELVGDIYDEDDIVEEDYVYLEDGVLEIAGEMRMDELLDILNIPYNDDIIEHKTVSAWTMEHLQNIPAVGDSFEDFGLSVSIKQLDGMRIEKLAVKAIKAEDEVAE
ncbi:MAG TPA: hemolysin family protein [Clostridia bacterium]|nr:MAG: Hemolysin C [Firmicutes bacterium ADurb.Bin146]HOD93147.1 hemolysin family protein [Clostridia bacterium]HQM39056.1 hemolysin family protein [Clostridia bacterium]